MLFFIIITTTTIPILISEHLPTPDTLKNRLIVNIYLRLIVNIYLPRYTKEWFITAVSQTQEEIGWGEDSEGFEIKQMQASILYTGVPSIVSELVVRFETRETLTNGGKILE